MRPTNVRINRGGRIIPCELAPLGVDDDGFDMWAIATVLQPGDRLLVEELPAKTGLTGPARHDVAGLSVTSRRQRPWAPVAWLLLAACILGAALYYATPAHADPRPTPAAICHAVDQWPTIGGILGITIDLADATGATDEQAGRYVATSILGTCPEYSSLLQQIVDRYRTKGQVA